MKKRILFLAHGHPDFSKGGAEFAAHALFEEFNRRDGWEAYLLARHGVPGIVHTGTAFAARPGGREILFSGGTDYFTFSSLQPHETVCEFGELLDRLRPQVLHFHHYVNLGIEMLRVARQRLPHARIVLTLHEYLAICNRNGQMVKTDGQLCYKSSPAECHACMPGRSPQDFFLRELYIKSFFGLVDHFIAPSHFLKQRYVAWGLPADRIHVIENGQPDEPQAPLRELPASAPRNRFAYFGQITPFKGLEVMLDAFERVSPSVKEAVQLDINGTGHHLFTPEFKEKIETLFRDAHRNVRYFGPYAPEDFPRLVKDVDWIVIPSIWWENSPLVIQEAFWHRRPVICSDIGGMAEKVENGVSGLHFRAGSAASLAETIERTASDPSLWARLVSGIKRPPTVQQSADALAALYV